MKIKYLLCSLMVVLCLPSQLLEAQDAIAKEAVKVIEKFQQKDAIAYQLDMRLYENFTAKTVAHKLRMNYRKAKERMYLQLDEYEIYQEAKDYWYIDKQSREIQRLKIANEMKESPQNDPTQLLEWIEILELKGQLVDGPPDTRRLRFTSTGKSKTVIELEYEISSGHLLHSMVALDLSAEELFTHPFDGQRLEISYHDHRSSGIFFPAHLQELKRNGQSTSIQSGVYEGYQIVQIQP